MMQLFLLAENLRSGHNLKLYTIIFLVMEFNFFSSKIAEVSEKFCLKDCIDFWLNTKSNIFALPTWYICHSYTDALETWSFCADV